MNEMIAGCHQYETLCSEEFHCMILFAPASQHEAAFRAGSEDLPAYFSMINQHQGNSVQ